MKWICIMFPMQNFCTSTINDITNKKTFLVVYIRIASFLKFLDEDNIDIILNLINLQLSPY